jgi:putative sterol carrier protein
MKSLDQYVEALQTALAGGSFGEKTARMIIHEVGSIYIDGASVTTEEKPADCVLSTDHQTYDQLFSGKLDPTIAFGKGDLQMDGDMGVALLMPPLFKKANV